MRICWRGAVLFFTVLFVWGNMGYADECDDVFDRARALWDAGNEAGSAADYGQNGDVPQGDRFEVNKYL